LTPACSIGGPGMDAIADAIVANKTIKEIFLTNQRTVIPSKSGTRPPLPAGCTGRPLALDARPPACSAGPTAEMKLAKAVEVNQTLQKLAYVCRDLNARQYIDKYIFRNKDIGAPPLTPPSAVVGVVVP